MKIGVIIADDKEFEAFFTHWKDGKSENTKLYDMDCIEISLNGSEIFVVHSGIGKVNSAKAAIFLITEKKVDTILNTGYSGAVHAVHRNEIVIGKSYIECDFDMTCLGYKPAQKPAQEVYLYYAPQKLIDTAVKTFDAPVVNLGTGDFFLTDTELKKKYYEQFNISAFDMESGAIASICYDLNVDFISIRKVSDDSEDSATEDYRELNNSCDECFSDIIGKMVNALIL